jgi:glycosyltransferase involved in cell wall biosynthesis
VLSDAPLSVIIPCRNGEHWLVDAIDSVLSQTVRPMEILVVDDGSRDRSARIAQSFGPPIRVLPSRWRGCNGARCTGVIESRGEFIAFVDADDVLMPAKHERQLAVLEDADAFTIVHTGSMNFWADGSQPSRVRSGAHEATGRCTRVIFESNPVCGASVMARRATILALGNYRPRIVMAGD